jgi:hypothetical protein
MKVITVMAKLTNVFVVGHGFQTDRENRFKVFPNCAVTFYCKDGGMFDSAWEDIVMTKVKNGEQPSASDIGRAKDEWEVSTFNDGSHLLCRDYLITRPGSIALTVAFKDCKEISTDASAKTDKVDAVSNGDTLCIKNKMVPYTTLSSLLHRVSRDGSKLHVHWLACRSPTVPMGDLINQASSFPSLRKTTAK